MNAVIAAAACDDKYYACRLVTRTHSHTHTHPVNVPSLPGEVPSKWKNNVLFRALLLLLFFFLVFFLFLFFGLFSLFFKIFISFIPCSRKNSDFVFCECVFYRFFFLLLQPFFFINYLNVSLNEMHVSKKRSRLCPFHSLFILFFLQNKNSKSN